MPRPSRSELRRELLDVVRVEDVGPYRLLRLRRGRLESGIPGQFFMLSPGRLLPRPMSLRSRPAPSSASSSTRSDRGRRRSPPSSAASASTCSGRSEMDFGSTSKGRCSWAGGSGRAVSLPLRASWTAACRARLPFGGPRRGSGARPECRGGRRAAPRNGGVARGHDVLACGPEPMLRAVADFARGAARLGGADGLRLRRVLRLRRRDPRGAQASLRVGPVLERAA